jgi:ferritin-like metal-binding protein YciE
VAWHRDPGAPRRDCGAAGAGIPGADRPGTPTTTPEETAVPSITDPRARFLHGRRDTLHAERQVEKLLPRMAREAADAGLRQGFEHHLEETRAQVANLERVFAALGERARAERCPGIEGIRTEHDEIAADTGLIAMAQALGERDAASLLKENLDQEKATLGKVESAGRRLARDTAGQAAAA